MLHKRIADMEQNPMPPFLFSSVKWQSETKIILMAIQKNTAFLHIFLHFPKKYPVQGMC